MKRDSYYKILGLTRKATAAEIKTAYRSLAKKYHPDQNPNNQAAEERFKAIVEAYRVLSDSKSKILYDKFNVVPEGSVFAPKNQTQFSPDQWVSNFKRYSPTMNEYVQAVKEAVKDRIKRKRGKHLKKEIELSFKEAILGGEHFFTLPRRNRLGDIDQRKLSFVFPVGMKDGQVLRWKKEGVPGVGGGEYGDFIVTIRIQKDPVFERLGEDIHSSLSLTLDQLLLGGDFSVATIHGIRSLTVPKMTKSGSTFRIPNCGVGPTDSAKGDAVIIVYQELPIGLTQQQYALLNAFLYSLEPWQLPEKAKLNEWLKTQKTP